MIFFVYLLIFLVTKWVLWEIQQAFSDVEETTSKHCSGRVTACQWQLRGRGGRLLQPWRRVG